MLISIRQIILLVFCLAAATISGHACAQPLGKSHQSVESLIAPAEFVAIGSIAKVEEIVIVEPGAVNRFGDRNERGEIEYVLNTKFSEVLKKVDGAGDDGQFELFRTIDRSAGRNENLTQLAKDETAGLWLIQPKHATETFRRWEFVPFDGVGVNHFGYHSTSSLQPPMFASDLSMLTTKKEILKRATEYGAISQMEHDPAKLAVASVRIPYAILGDIESGDYNMLSLPIDSELKSTARRLIESPGDFVSSADAARDPHALDMLRESGIELLGQMKTEASIQLLRDCLDDSVLPFEHSRNDHRIRIKAYERLLDWRVDPPRPAFGSKITRLFLAESGINDDTLKLVSELENLETLYLYGVNISHVGIEHLKKLKRLKFLSLGNELLTDDALRVLRKHNQLHLIEQATTSGELQRPDSPEDVATLKFWYAPFSDVGLSEFVDFENVIRINLSGTNVTDAGIEHLAKFKKLKYASLTDSKVTEAGVATLREALPNCKIEH